MSFADPGRQPARGARAGRHPGERVPDPVPGAPLVPPEVLAHPGHDGRWPFDEPGEAVEGPEGRLLWRASAPPEVPVGLDLGDDGAWPTWDRRQRDRADVERLLGRPPRSSFAVVVRDVATGAPVVIRNPPLLDDGTPMPTRYWLVGWNAEVGTLEAAGGVRTAEAEVDPEALAACHDRYAAERDAALPVGWAGPRPSGGVGGTRRGVKCLHTHYAHWLATGDDPVGAWVHAHLGHAVRPDGADLPDLA